MIDFGICSFSGEPKTAARLAAWRDMGITHSRFAVDASVVFAKGTLNPDGSADVQPDFSTSDPVYEALMAAGISAELDSTWFPSWVTGGEPNLQRYEQGWWDVQTDPKTGVPIGVTRNHLGVDPKPANPNAVRAIAQSLAERYPSAVLWTVLNEPDFGYFPATQGPPEVAAIAEKRLLDEIWIPWVEGVRDVIPDAKFGGPETAGADFLRRVLEEERNRGLHLFDRLRQHFYGDKTIPGSYLLAADVWRVINESGLRDGRPVDCSEYDGPDLDVWADGFLRLLGRGPNYEVVGDVSGIMFGTDARFFNADDTLTPLGVRVKAVIGKVNG